MTASRYMPPWKPQPGWGHFVGERRLTDAQVKTLADWAAAGAPEGDHGRRPAAADVHQRAGSWGRRTWS